MNMPVWTTMEDVWGRHSPSRDGGPAGVGVGRHDAMMAGDDDDIVMSTRGVMVQVRDREIDTLNAFDKYPRMMHHLVRNVIATERFQR